MKNFSKWILDFFVPLGRWCRFTWQSLGWAVRPPFRFNNFFKQLEFIGVQSIPIIMLTGLFTGMVFALQTGKTFSLFRMQNLVGSTVGLALTREIGPVFTALMVTARVCSAMAAEIGTMRVSEQIDALQTMAVDPLQYLVVPRVLGCILMLPLLTIIFNFVGIVGAYAVGTTLLDIPAGPFLHHLYWYVDPEDINGGLIKAAFFGFFIAMISCYKGFLTKGGAEGVGRATTGAVVASSVTVLITDYFLTTWILEYYSSHNF
ncbi:MAG: ABC transporter permease [Deltaproteobacteria bacterium RIFCSPLOWO2_02_FULL_46_8]|nr:MAG: ABC transporter permease [Deltaproteobacteria bacterium RIFCSPLOWO2_02_FULL_46_8]